MIINNTFGFIFVHVPKAAGTTITSVLRSASCYCDIEVGGTALGEAIQPFYKQRFGLAKHSTAREIKSVVGEVKWKQSFTFAIVRNPYARIYSAFNFMKKVRAERNLSVLEPLDRLHSFVDFVESDFFNSDGMDRILMPQIFWLRADAKDSPVIVDFVGKVEQLAESLRTIGDALPAARKYFNPAEIPQLNRTDSELGLQDGALDWLAIPHLEHRVHEKYKMDFKVFNYARHGES